MVNMHLLEEWINQLLAQSVAALNRRFGGDGYGNVEQELDALLGGVNAPGYSSHEVAACVLEALHQKVRGRTFERALWGTLVFRLSRPLPGHVAHDLIDRNVDICALGHTRQEYDVQWRLASLVDEALLTLALDMFTDPRYDVAEFEKLLSLYPEHDWLLYSWEHWALLSPVLREREKEIAFHRWAWQHPGRRRQEPGPYGIQNVPTPERYLEIMAEKQRSLEEQVRREREAGEEKFLIDSEIRQC